MAMQQIEEVDPWLEQDEEEFFCVKKEETIVRSKARSSSLITKIASFSVYSYLAFTIFAKSQIIGRVFKMLFDTSLDSGSFYSTALVVLSLLLKKYQSKLVR